MTFVSILRKQLERVFLALSVLTVTPGSENSSTLKAQHTT